MNATVSLQEQVDKIAHELAPDVARIRYQFGLDWSNDAAVYFRVVLSDEASGSRLAAVTDLVREKLYGELELDKEERIPYFQFRSLSEQTSLGEASWN